MAWTTATLLAHTRRVASLPSVATAAGYTDADILAHADAALQSHLAPLVVNSRDEHGIHFETLSVASGQEYLRLPSRVAAGRLRDVVRQGTTPQSWLSMPRYEPEDVARLNPPIPAGPVSSAFVIEAGFLRFVPVPTQAMTLRISYVRTPSSLVTTATCLRVTGIDVNTGNWTVSGTTGVGPWDIILQSNGDSFADGIAASVVSPTVFNLLPYSQMPRFVNTAAETQRYIAEGLWTCPAGSTCIVPLPDILSALLAQRTAVGVMNAIGDAEGVDRASAVLERMEREVVPVMSERVEGEPQVLRPRAMSRGRAFWRP